MSIEADRWAEADRLLAELDVMPLPPPASARGAGGERRGHGDVITYSRKVFIPLTRLCRDVCRYCTFAAPPRKVARLSLPTRCWRSRAPARPRLPGGAVHARRQAGAAIRGGARRRSPRSATRRTIDYLARDVRAGAARDRPAAARQSRRDERGRDRSAARGQRVAGHHAGERRRRGLCERGGPHYGSPDKAPAVRLAMIDGGRARSACRSPRGILIGIGETRARAHRSRCWRCATCTRATATSRKSSSRISAPSPAPAWRRRRSPTLDDLLWTAADGAARSSGPQMNIQAPPNLSYARFPELLAAGINDWGGVSPVTPDHVNPEAPWPHLDRLRRGDRGARASAWPSGSRSIRHYAREPERWLDPDAAHARAARRAIATGLRAPTPGRRDRTHSSAPPTSRCRRRPRATATLDGDRAARQRADDGSARTRSCALFAARGARVRRRLRGGRCAARARQRRHRHATSSTATSTTPTSARMRCRFCAFSKGKLQRHLRGPAYDLDARRDRAPRRAKHGSAARPKSACRAASIRATPARPISTSAARRESGRAATSTCMRSRRSRSRTARATLGADGRAISRAAAATRGSAACRAPRRKSSTTRCARCICPDKLTTREWLDVVEAAHAVGLRTTATIMFGHVERPGIWARHLLHIRDLQERTGGFTEFVPLPFVHMEAPMYLKGRRAQGADLARGGADARGGAARAASADPEHPGLLGEARCRAGARCLDAGANDLGGTLMNESISRAAGTQHGQELPPAEMER